MSSLIGRRALRVAVAVVATVVVGGCGGGQPTVASVAKPRPPARATVLGAPSLAVTAAGHLPAPVQAPATTALGGRALLMGGLDQADVSVSDIVLAGADGARRLGALPQALHDAAAATAGPSAYVLGGGEPSHSEITAVDQTGKATLVGQLPAPASDVAAAAIGSTVYVVCGYTGTEPLRSIVAWSGAGPGRVVATVPHPLRYAAVAAVAGRLIIAGGTNGDSATADIYSFDPTTDRVSHIGVLPRPLTHAAAAALRGFVYVIGGRGGVQGTQTAQILAVDPASGRVTSAGRLPVALSDAGVASIGDAVVLAGGREATGTLSDRVLLLRPATRRR